MSLSKYMIVLHQEAVIVTQIVLTFSIVTFCIVQLTRSQPTSVYVPFLTGIVGYWLPSPKLANTTVKAEAPTNEVV